MTTPKREVLAEGVELWLGDMADILPSLIKGGIFDACVTDPPYGIGEAAGRAKTRTSGLNEKVRHQYRRDYGDDAWDDQPISDDQIAMVMASAKWKIIFGGKYYALPPTSCWLVWDKLNGDTDFADCELAWTNLPKAVRRIQFLWNGCFRRERDVVREHPTQKPIGVMMWCLEHLPKAAMTVLDPFMGSGTTGVASVRLGKRFVGIEQSQKFFDVACRRIGEAQRHPDMFIPKPNPAKQEAFL